MLIFRKNKGQQQYSDNQYGFFWQTMQLCDWDQEGNDMLVLKPVIEFLSKQKDRKIFLFHDMMSELLYALNTRELAAQCKKAYALMTDDSFLYSRCVALINGPEYYANVKDGLCKDLWTMEFEAILYVPLEAWARKHGKEPEDYPHEPPFSYETESNADGWK